MELKLMMRVAVGLAGLGTIALAACSSQSPQTSEPNVMSTPGPTQVANIPGATPGSTTPATDTPDTDPRELEVLWVVADHAGAGALTVRFATNTETTAEVTTYRSAPDAPGFPAEVSSEPKQVHVVSIPTGMEDFGVEVVVTDGAGRRATALLELGSIVGKQYWARGAGAAPGLAVSGMRATATWTNLRSSGEPDIPGRVLLFAKRAGCTTAEACEGELVEMFTGDSPGGDQVIETHRMEVLFPDATHDYQVVLAGRPGTDSAARMFYQFDVRAGEIGK